MPIAPQPDADGRVTAEAQPAARDNRPVARSGSASAAGPARAADRQAADGRANNAQGTDAQGTGAQATATADMAPTAQAVIGQEAAVAALVGVAIAAPGTAGVAAGNVTGPANGTAPARATTPGGAASSGAGSVSAQQGAGSASEPPNQAGGSAGTTADASAPPATADRLAASSQTAAPAANQRFAATAADIAGLAAQSPAPASDHKITLHPVETAADVAQPDGQPGAPSVALLEQAAPPVTAAVVTTVTAAAAPAQAHPATLTEQVAPALLTLAKTADGGQQMTVRLQPGDLGMVQVRIAREASGSTQIEITADNPSTLLALQRDQPQLHRTLDQAGIPAAGRNVSFHAAEVQAAAGSNGGASAGGHGNSQPGSSSGSAGFGSSGRGQAGMSDAGGSSGGRGGYATRERGAYAASRQMGTTVAPTGTAATPATQSYRIGLDITA